MNVAPQTAGNLFIGRERELTELTAGLRDALAGHGELILLAGKPGIGKTRLANEVAPTTAEQQPTAHDAVFRKDGDSWTVTFAGTALRLKDGRGLAYIAHLLRHPDQEFHATDLVAAVQGGGGAPAASASARAAVGTELERRSLRDTAEPVLDPQPRRRTAAA